MPSGLPHLVRDNLEKCRSAAIAAVEAYNRPGPRFRTAQYLILISIAWTALFHAIFYRRNRRPWYRQKSGGAGRGVRYIKVDGEPKHWELTECIRQHFGDQHPPERKNLEFVVGLRNKIEHRHLPSLDAALYGECQAALLNLETMLVDQFGSKYALTDQLAISLQFSRMIPQERSKATTSFAASASKTVTDYIEKFRTQLPEPILNSMKYSFSVFLVPRVANRASAADAAVQFVRVDEASTEELNRLQKLNVLIREKHIPIVNLNLYRPGKVVDAVQAQIPYRLNMAAHTSAWRHFGVRPISGSSHPERTKGEHCVYDEAHHDYLYTQAWVEKLVCAFSDSAEFNRIVGRAPLPKKADSDLLHSVNE